MIKITHNGRPFDAKRFAADIEAKAIALGMQAIEEKARGAAASIVDPETGHHADVFVDRLPGNKVAIRTTGSPAFARLIEKRLGVDPGKVQVMNAADGAAHPKVYLAHASEDKARVRPVAEYLMANGIEVWFDEWEIEPGDSLRQKMEEGLGAMTHFVVVLTETSIAKPWVAKEIDVGMVQQVGGKSRFVPLVVDLDPAKLSPFMQAMLFLKIDPASEVDLKGLVDRLHGVSRKPALGEAPRYVQNAPKGLEGWSAAAVAIGRHIVETSGNAMLVDPAVTLEDLQGSLDLASDDLRIALLDLKDGGYLREMNVRGHYAPQPALFVDFDEVFMPFSPSADAAVLANRMVTGDDRAVDTKGLAEALGWAPRRINSAICYLERVGAIRTRTALASAPWRAVQLVRTDETLRFARNHA
ncbi:molecular chaperone Tir (plasmid) [Sphingomonas panacis]|uniref:Molecular chaperone Tir n=1 Tax=Sphingomonas panacis TaxID=1560345 RepID=A0A1B3ZIB0_9SPHN|nr:toll/interleukin-1 receptor domain-containing protein [Sphingomonas panacis]AOH87155.1 molecular chaperone Tir [Sphingomonas panacis]